MRRGKSNTVQWYKPGTTYKQFPTLRRERETVADISMSDLNPIGRNAIADNKN